MRQSFETSVGTLQVTVDEESRTLSAYRFDADGRTVAAAMESWDYVDLGQVLRSQLGLPSAEAEDLAARVRARVAMGPRPAPRKVLPSYRPSALEPAGLALRFVAVLLDTVIVLFPLALLVGLLTGGGYSQRGNGYARAGIEVGGSAAWLLLLVALAYYVFCEAATGMTLGKRMVGIQVVDEEGDAVGFGAAVVRNVLRVVDGLFFYLVGFVIALVSAERQRLGDRVAHTVVVRR